MSPLLIVLGVLLGFFLTCARQPATIGTQTAGPLPAGRYETFLWLPDPASTIRTRPEYALQLANVGTWEPHTGYNRLRHVIEIGGAAPGNRKIDYAESEADLLNPERGAYHLYVSSPEAAIEDEDLRGRRAADSVNLVRLVFNLKDFRDGEIIPTSYLAKMQREFGVLREIGLKAIPRFVYDYSATGDNDVPFDRLSRHIDQVAPIVNSNTDVIAAFEVGLIGKYGEWWDSTNYGSELIPESNALRLPVVQKVLDSFRDRPVLLRSPSFLRYMIDHGVSPEARLGMHNDAFLAGPSDWNTFASAADREWLEGWSLGRAIGGEHEVQPNVTWTDEDRIANYDDFARQHWSYLNPYFHPRVIDLWKRTPHADGGTYWDNILQNLGYRIKLSSASFPKSLAVGADIPIRIELENVGWASPFNPRDVVLVLRNVETLVEHHFPLAVDPRDWRGEVTISGVLRISGSIGVTGR